MTNLTILKFLISMGIYNLCALASAQDFKSEMKEVLRQMSPSSEYVEIAATVINYSENPKGEILFQKDFSDPNKLTHLASMSKHMTGAAIGLLIQKEQLSIENLISDYLPNLPSYTKELKIKDLLGHMSGLPEYTDLCSTELTYQPHQVLDFLKKKGKLLFSPGSRYNYTNTNYVLLALIVEKISGKTFPQFMNKEFWQPLGMGQTWIRSEDGHSKPPYSLRTNYYNQEFLGYLPIPKLGCEYVFGDGGVFTTLKDLRPWAGMLLGHGILDDSTLEKMRTSFILNEGKITKYSFGMNGPFGNSPWISYSHGGIWAGTKTSITLVPEKQLAIIVLANGNDVKAMKVDSIALKLLKKYYP